MPANEDSAPHNPGDSSGTQALSWEGDQPYRLLFEANPQPMWVFDQASKRMLAVNMAAVMRYGYAHEEFLQLSILDIRRTLQGERLTEAQVDRDPIGSDGCVRPFAGNMRSRTAS